MRMETPPSPPRSFSQKSSKDDIFTEPPKPTEEEGPNEVETGQTSMATPSTPNPVEACAKAHSGSVSVPRVYFSPGRGPGDFGGCPGAPVGDLTPVINNSSGAGVVDARDSHPAPGRTRPGILPRLPPALPTSTASSTSSPSSVATVLRASSSDIFANSGLHNGTPDEICLLSVPSCSDDDSSFADTSSSGGMELPSTRSDIDPSAASIFEQGVNFGLEAPIEISPDRKVSSFQGPGQYRQRVVASLETEPPCGSAPSAKCQYSSPERSRHGVKEMADAKDLAAIFKPLGNVDAADAGIGPEQHVPAVQREPRRPSLPALTRDQEEDASGLAHPYPVDSQWSIPSIRLANRVDRTLGGRPGGHADVSEYTDDDESYYSFLEDDGASLCSINDDGLENGTNVKADSTNATVLLPPPMTPKRGVDEFDDSEAKVLEVDTATINMDDVAVQHSIVCRQQHRGHCRGRRPMKEGASSAVEWLRELQDRSLSSNSPSSSGRDGGFLIAEAASSKFMNVGRRPSDSVVPVRKNAGRMTSRDAETKTSGVLHDPLPMPSTSVAGPCSNDEQEKHMDQGEQFRASDALGIDAFLGIAPQSPP